MKKQRRHRISDPHRPTLLRLLSLLPLVPLAAALSLASPAGAALVIVAGRISPTRVAANAHCCSSVASAAASADNECGLVVGT